MAWEVEAQLYGDMKLIDAHNHDACTYGSNLKLWAEDKVDQVVLFGDVSEPSAIESDRYAWQAYQDNPDQFIPYFSGINLTG